MKPYELNVLTPDGKVEKIKAVAIIAFEEDGKTIRLRIFDNPDITEDELVEAIDLLRQEIHQQRVSKNESHSLNP